MAQVISQREFRNDSAEIMRRLDLGESFIITRNGQPGAEMSPISIPAGLSALKTRASKLKAIDPVLLRNDLEELVES